MSNRAWDEVERGRCVAEKVAKSKNRELSEDEQADIYRAQKRLQALENLAREGGVNGSGGMQISSDRLRRKLIEATSSAENFTKEVKYSVKKDRIAPDHIRSLGRKLLDRIDKIFSDPEWERIEREQARDENENSSMANRRANENDTPEQGSN